MFKACVFMVSLFVTTVCQAQQKVPVQEGIEVTANVSSNVLNRIAVEHDRIMMVKGITGQFELDKDAELGQVFLKPISTENRDLIHLFLTTEKGHTYPLSLIVEEKAAQSILLVPLDEAVAPKWEQGSSYENLLKNIVQAMYTQTQSEGFVSDKLKTSQSLLPKIKQAKVTELQIYKSHKLRGKILEVTNTGKEELVLNEQNFYQTGVRAVAIVNPILSAKAKTRVFIVS